MIDKVRITRLVGGLNFGQGAISKDARLKDEKDPLNIEVISKIEEIIQSPQILVAVEADDDGCGDGRGVGLITRGRETLKRSLHRAKVFGGGLTMAVAAKIGLEQASTQSLDVVFADAMSELNNKKISFGAHTDEHAKGDNCGCGAIDKAPQIITNAGEYREQITGAINALTNEDNNETLDDIFAVYQAYSEATQDTSYKGSVIARMITHGRKVVKQLFGDHKETHIVINTVKGMTVNQELIREVSGGKAQVFGVDAWRMQEIANKMYVDDEVSQKRAYLSMLVYTLATAGTLTKGDLPVYVVQ